ncbi:hypothetical protein BKA69DRAFT_1062192 [Paraphysoderma sedebokerense]|nr:hypothetical protein BKA69DRAFT_1062192 [Paraphysoderma sedebokerense]
MAVLAPFIPVFVPLDVQLSLVKLSYDASSWILILIIILLLILYGFVKLIFETKIASDAFKPNQQAVVKFVHHAVHTNLLPRCLIPYITTFNLPTMNLARFYFMTFVFIMILLFSLSTSYDVLIVSVGANRFGHIALSLLLLTYLLSSRTISPFVQLLNIPQYTLIALHKFIATLFVLMVTVHFSIHTGYWASFNMLGINYQRDIIIFGLIAYICLLLILFSSTAIVRRRFYNLFYGSHVFLYTLITLFVLLHTPHATSYFIIVMIFHIFERIIRFIRLNETCQIVEFQQCKDLKVVRMSVKVGTNTVAGEGSPEVDTMMVKVTKLFAKVATMIRSRMRKPPKPGSYAHIMFPPVPITHPFTIVSYKDSTFTFFIKSSTFTEAELQLRSKLKVVSVASNLLNSDTDWKVNPLKVGFDGPFRENYQLNLFECVVLVATGIGITPWISWLDWFVEQWNIKESKEGEPNTRRVNTIRVMLIWVVKDLKILELWTPPSHPNLVTVIHVTSNSSEDVPGEGFTRQRPTLIPYPVPADTLTSAKPVETNENTKNSSNGDEIKPTESIKANEPIEEVKIVVEKVENLKQVEPDGRGESAKQETNTQTVDPAELSAVNLKTNDETRPSKTSNASQTSASTLYNAINLTDEARLILDGINSDNEGSPGQDKKTGQNAGATIVDNQEVTPTPTSEKSKKRVSFMLPPEAESVEDIDDDGDSEEEEDSEEDQSDEGEEEDTAENDDEGSQKEENFENPTADVSHKPTERNQLDIVHDVTVKQASTSEESTRQPATLLAPSLAADSAEPQKMDTHNENIKAKVEVTENIHEANEVKSVVVTIENTDKIDAVNKNAEKSVKIETEDHNTETGHKNVEESNVKDSGEITGYVKRIGRPNFNDVIQQLSRGAEEIDGRLTIFKNSKSVAIGVCAPYPVVHDLREAVSTLRNKEKMWWVVTESFEV